MGGTNPPQLHEPGGTAGDKKFGGFYTVALCHVHKDVLDLVNATVLMKEFVLARDGRTFAFGQIATSS